MDNKIGELEFRLYDYREDCAFTGVGCTFDLRGNPCEVEDLVSIDDYWYFCTRFASAMGFTEKTINDYFGIR